MTEYYPEGYREDEEMDVYDQCCDNCALCGSCLCPLDIPEDGSSEIRKAVKKRIKEDAIVKNGEIQWCVNWKQEKKHRRY